MANVQKKNRVQSGKVLVVYHYYEKDQSYIDNFSHFLRFGYCVELNYLIIIAGEYTIDFPLADNIKYFFTENKNFDYGGYCAAICELKAWQEYDFYLFINSSVRGPFIPAYDNQNWTDLFIDLFSNEVGIVGSAISITPSHHSIAKMYYGKYGIRERNDQFLGHVQTTCYALTRPVLEQLVKLGFYEGAENLNKDETICHYEIRLSQLIVDMGLNLRCILPEYNQVDYRKELLDINPSSREGDSGFERSYFGRSVHPYESIFIKTSRATLSEEDLMRLAHSMSINLKLNDALERQHFMRSFVQKIQASSLGPREDSRLQKKSLLKSMLNRFK
ncbi:hypothetical protein CL55_00002540 [Polynucleobacter duraquae]|uniref:Rhamnan synthesis protein F n=1 Tax=Polynucleobacter duraquae TaxID=1835254 RepID=A0A0E3ZIM8_9BURK|nr:hypothetical protein [Polynucleobacter duraquae]AKD24587.1 hypothetical protein CL55_00002540 [Polynucleobacter duraquae]